ncbi:Fe-S cluster assembly protein SufD [Horticoccus luteus]|uniref:Fe-S cluster assembly protein SufD n=1 Tax=Horticoccus luteus TaxID=2862869 RepID=A0A8F9TRA6_9BACT|nr:Fe-S cluster assembly protein SufD [Horticoccus luteus]QYM77536.1 Fe-S cluster assembly protein SufD [Horticoccus luteus]
MPASTLPLTAATGAFTAEAFAAHLASQTTAPAWWLERKRAAFARFAELPMPARGDESWRFSSVGQLSLEGAAVVPPAAPGCDVPLDFGPSAAHLCFSNNQLAHRRHPADALAAQGVIVTTIADALVTHPELLRRHFMAQPQKLGSEKFTALHVAFLRDGAFVYVPRGVEIADPILITHVMAGSGTAVFPHTLVVAEENAKVTVVDYFVSTDRDSGAHQLAVGANDLYAAHGAQLNYVAVQDWSRDTLSFQFNSTVTRRDARNLSLNVHLGGRQARHESHSQLQAPGAHSEMLALTVARGSQEFDQRTLQMHQAPNTSSNLLYKNALLDSSRTIFSGLIVVDPDAQKTDAYQSNRNLMLSDDAEANSLPGLEIQANDVRCTHGATTARIDPEQGFYLQARGIDPRQAHELLVFGFFEEVLNKLDNDALHAALSALIQKRFHE